MIDENRPISELLDDYEKICKSYTEYNIYFIGKIMKNELNDDDRQTYDFILGNSNAKCVEYVSKFASEEEIKKQVNSVMESTFDNIKNS